jgi:NADH-quinone oxidoreductase subunit N
MNEMNWPAVYPEIFLLLAACFVALADLWSTDPKRTLTYRLTQGSLAIVALMYLSQYNEGLSSYAMQRMVVSDPMGNLLAFFASVAVMISLAYARPYAESRDLLKGELFTLSLFSLLGILVMVSANNFLVVYLGLELMSLSLYALTAMRRDSLNATEAAMKYFVLGALASGFLLYGLSMMYGATGSLDIGEVFKAIATGQINKAVLVFGVVFVVSGLAFKLGAVPFHMWVPDVYQGAPTAITLLIGGAPKLAAFAITMRLLVEGMSGVAEQWQQMLVVLAVGSMAIGNLSAIAQSNLKRMLAAANGYSSAMFYIVTYVLTTLGTFGVIMLLSRQGFESENIDDLKGLARRSPWYAGVMAIFMFSLAGLPPTVGFYAKFSVLQAIVVTNVTGYIVLAVAAVMFSLIGAFYYLRIVKVMYFDEPTDTSPIVASGEVKTLLSLNGAAVLLFGLLPGGLMALCVNAIGKALTT